MKKLILFSLLALFSKPVLAEPPVIWNASCSSGIFNLALNTCLTSGGGGGAVSSVFGRTGIVTAQSSDYSSFFLQISNNLSDLASASTARTNLGLGTAATQASSAFDAAGSAAAAQAASDPVGSAATAQAASLQKSSNLSDLASASTARTNLGLTPVATASTGNLTEATSSVLTITGGTGAVIGSGITLQVSQAGASTSGYLGTTDWNTFNAKQPALTFTAPLVNTSNTISASLFGGDSGSGGTAGAVPAPAAYSAQSGNFLGAGGSFTYVDQSKPNNAPFALVSQQAATPSGVKFESTTIFTSTTTGKKYAIGVGFVSNPLTIWDISDQTSPVLVSTIVESGGGAYNATVGVVSGVQYAFVGYNSGSKLAVFNLTNPAAPSLVGTTVIAGSPGSIYGVAFLNGYVYCATQNAGLTVMDVGGGTGSPAAPVQTYQQGSAKSFGVVAIGSNVYTTMYSTSSPYTVRQLVSWTLSSPGSASVPSQLQSLQVTAAGEALGLSVSGNTAFVTTAATGAYNINLVDITTPSSMANLSQINSANAFGSAFYAVASGNYVYVPSGGNGTYGGAIDAYDISNRSLPVHIAQVTSGNVSSAFGGLALSGGYIFVADYGTSAGANPYFDVFTALDPANVVGNEVASTLTVKNLLSVPVQASGVSPSSPVAGSLGLTSAYILCVYTGSAWVQTSNGSTSCTF